MSPTDQIPKDFGSRLRILREAAGMDQAQLGAEVAKRVTKKDGDYAQSTVSRWEENKIVPTFEAFVAIVAALECSSDFLLGLSDSRSVTRRLESGDWVINNDAVDRIRENQSPPKGRFAWPVPRRYTIMSPTEYADLESDLQRVWRKRPKK